VSNTNDPESEQSRQQPESTNTSGQELTIRRGDPNAVNLVPEQEPAGIARVTSPEQRLLFTPTIDIFNTEEGLVLRADLPGVCVERVDLQIEDNKLTLFGRVQENLPDNARLLHREYQVGDFYRSFILSDEVAYDRITAKMNAGVLEITLPRLPRVQPRKIPVQTD
jgi:HSP20 family protein